MDTKIIQGDNQIKGFFHFPLHLPKMVIDLVSLADENYTFCSSCIQSPPLSFFLEQWFSSATPHIIPYNQKGVTFRVTCNFQKASRVSNSRLTKNLYIIKINN